MSSANRKKLINSVIRREALPLRVTDFFIMIRKEASPEVLEKIKRFSRIDFVVFKIGISQKVIVPFCKLKTPRTIFYDDETKNFLYLNPYYGNFQKCGEYSKDFNIIENLIIPE